MLNSCKTSPKKDKNATKIDVYIPSFPEPIDKNGDFIVKTNENFTEITIPFWYWLQITQYAIDVENAAQILQNY